MGGAFAELLWNPSRTQCAHDRAKARQGYTTCPIGTGPLLTGMGLDPERSTEVRERQEVRGGKGRIASTAADRRPQGTMTARPVTLPSCSSP